MLEMADEFAKAYASVLLKTAQTWVFNCDGGCFADVCERECWTKGPYLCIYQPHKSMRDYDDMFATVFIKRTDKAPITKAEFAGHVVPENLMLQSYNEYLAASGGHWTHAIDGTFKQLVQIREALHLEKGTARFTFEIRGATNGCCGDIWWPHKLDRYLNGGDEEAVIDGVIQDDEFAEKLARGPLATVALL